MIDVALLYTQNRPWLTIWWDALLWACTVSSLFICIQWMCYGFYMFFNISKRTMWETLDLKTHMTSVFSQLSSMEKQVQPEYPPTDQWGWTLKTLVEDDCYFGLSFRKFWMHCDISFVYVCKQITGNYICCVWGFVCYVLCLCFRKCTRLIVSTSAL